MAARCGWPASGTREAVGLLANGRTMPRRWMGGIDDFHVQRIAGCYARDRTGRHQTVVSISAPDVGHYNNHVAAPFFPCFRIYPTTQS